MTNEFKKLLGLITEELEHSGGNRITLYEIALFNAGLSDTDVRRGLGKLAADGLIVKKPEIKYAPNKKQPTNPMHADFSSAPNDTYDKLVYVLSVDRNKITAAVQKIFARISYNENTGIGLVNGVRFKFKDDQAEFFVFPKLFERIGETLERETVLRLSHYQKEDGVDLKSVLLIKNPKRKTSSYISETYFINELVKKIRKMTGLNTDQLVNNNGNLTLIGEKTITSSG